MFKNLATWLLARFAKQPLVLSEKQVHQGVANIFQKEVEAAERRDKTAGRYLSGDPTNQQSWNR